MVRLFLFLTMLSLPSFMIADYMNVDIKTMAQVEMNTAAQLATEALHDVEIDSIKSKQENLSARISTMAMFKSLYYNCLEETKDFNKNSKLYKSIYSTMIRIGERTVSAVDAISKTNTTGKAIATIKTYEILAEAVSLGNVFYNMVSYTANPITLEGSDNNKDKYNFLNRSERLRLALDIRKRLKKIETQLRLIEYYCKYNSLNTLLMNVDRKTWATLTYSKMQTNRLIERWNKIKE